MTIRVAVKRRLVVVMASVVPSGVDVQYAYNARLATTRELVVMTDTIGGEEIRAQRSGRKRRDDEFSQTVWIKTHVPYTEPYEAEERLEAIWGPIEKGFADPAIIGPVLYGAGTWTAITGLVSCVVQDVHGPNAVEVGGGWGAESRFTLKILTSLD